MGRLAARLCDLGVSFVTELFNSNPVMFGVLLVLAIAVVAGISWIALDAGVLSGQRRVHK
jgi:uncharacterized membrane protein YgaE (UPF0421/DUF939 family)